ncbi:MAG: hypothetical protein P8Y02_13340 [Deinococcales bacterium]
MGRGAWARLGRARTYAFRYTWGILTVLVSLVSAGLADTTPQGALAAVDPDLADARAELAARERALAGPYGFDADVTLQQSVGFGTYDAAAAPPEWTTAIYVDATVGYSYDEPARLAALADLERARAAVARLRRRGPARALAAHARMLQLQLTARQLEEQVATQEEALAGLPALPASPAGGATALPPEGVTALAGGSAGAPRPRDPGGPGVGASAPDPHQPAVPAPAVPAPGARQRRLRTLGLEGLRLQLEQTRLELAAVGAELDRYGLSAPAAYAPVRFVLPPAEAAATSAYRLRVLAVRRAEADLRQAGVYDTFQGLALTGSVASGNVALHADLGIVEAHPRAELSLGFPGGPDAWSVGIQATVVLSTDGASLPESRRRLQASRAALEAYERDFPREAARRRAAAELAERALALAEQQRALAGTRDARRTLYLAWAEYVRQVRAYLQFVDGRWEARTP